MAARLRRDVPLATLLARWVAVLRPDLALHSGPLGRLVAMLRDQARGFWSDHEKWVKKGRNFFREVWYLEVLATNWD